MSHLEREEESCMGTRKAQARKEVFEVTETPRYTPDAMARDVTLTVLYILNWALDLELKSFSEPEETANCLTMWVRSRKSLKRNPCSSLLLLVLYNFPLCRSFRGPRQLVRELKISCLKRNCRFVSASTSHPVRRGKPVPGT